MSKQAQDSTNLIYLLALLGKVRQPLPVFLRELSYAIIYQKRATLVINALHVQTF